MLSANVFKVAACSSVTAGGCRSARHVNLSNMATSISVPNIVAAAELGDASQGYYFASVESQEHLTVQRVSENKVTCQPFAAFGQGTRSNKLQLPTLTL